MSIVRAIPCLAAAAVLLAVRLGADALDECYWRTFYILPIGAYDDAPTSSNYLGLIRSRLLASTGGVQPPNVKAGFSMTLNFIYSTQGAYYDHIYLPLELDEFVRLARAFDLPAGLHVNGTPWADPPQQALDTLSNFLEKHDGGALLQVDRLGRIRNAARAQEPTADEVYDGFADMLEMQVTLSRNAALVQKYLARNCRIGMRLYQWYREQHPDLLVFASMSSEYAQNNAANSEYCDYSTWSRQEFRDWLSGAGWYIGQAQYASLSAFNSAFSGASGFACASWDAVQPPTTVLWDTSANGRWWQKWHEFRIAQVRTMVQEQIRWCGQAGWSPDRLYGHQIPFSPTTTSNSERRYASPWTTTFVDDGGNGITTYGSRASNATIFNAIYANDKSWGIFEWNPLDTTVAGNLTALNTVWNTKAHVLCPYAWYGQPDYQILDKPIETAIAQFIGAQNTSVWTGLNYWETAPSAREVVWEMSAPADIEGSSGIAGLSFSNGVARGVMNAADALLWFDHNESASYLIADGYQAVSFRLELTNTVSGNGLFVWADESDVLHTVAFSARPGWHVYRINLANHPDWREKRVKGVALRPATAPVGGAFALDWLRLEAQPCWHFNHASEIYGAQNFSSLNVSGGSVNGITANQDGYFYFSTDKRDPAQDADRAGIEADYFTHARVRITSSAAGNGQFYWWRRDGVFHWRDFPVQAGTHTYVLELAANTNWSGTITRFRIDPISIPGATVSVEYASFMPAMLPPRVLRDDVAANSPAPVFAWDAAVEPGVSGMLYRLELADDFFFTNVVFAATNAAREALVYEGALRDGLHWWRVRAEDAQGARSPWCVPMPLFLRSWTCDRAGDVVLANDFGPATVTNGVWQATTTGSDPYLYFNTPSGRGINADVYKVFRCRVKVGTAAVNPTQFFFFPRAGGFHVLDVQLPADNQWHELHVDLSAHPHWTGDIAYVRIDPGAQAGLTVALDMACMLPFNGSAAAATWDGGGADTSWDTPANWMGDNAPLNDAPVTFAGTQRLAPVNTAPGRRVSGIAFASDAGAFTLGGAVLTNNGGIVNYSSSAQTLNLDMASHTAHWLVNTAGGAVTLNGMLSGAAGLIQVGGAPLTLTHPGNTYSGATIVSAGTLRVTGRTGSGPVHVAAGATLEGSGTINAPLTLAGGATLMPGPGITTLTNNGTLAFSAGARYAWEVGNSGNGDLVRVSGALQLPASLNSVTVHVSRASGTPYGPYLLCSTTAGISGASNAVHMIYHDGLEGAQHPVINGGNLTIHIVPEPCRWIAVLAWQFIWQRIRRATAGRLNNMQH